MSRTPRTTWRDALAGLPDARSLDERGVLRLLDDLREAQAALDAHKARAAGQLTMRWNAFLDDPVLRDGHRSPTTMLAEKWKIPTPAAKQWCDVGSAVTPRTSLLGEELPPEFPVVAAALGADAADAGAGDADAGDATQTLQPVETRPTRLV